MLKVVASSKETIDTDSDREEGGGTHVLRLPLKPLYRVLIEHFSHNTYRALLYYLECRQVNWKALSSSSKSQKLHVETISKPPPIEGQPPAVSPRSLYRLCRYIDLDKTTKLSALCLEEYGRQITGSNAVKQLFSDFCEKFPEARALAMRVTKDNWHRLVEDPSRLKRFMREHLSNLTDSKQIILGELLKGTMQRHTS